nr:membrane protein insertion efficiency factor YidD [Entomospira culicis]
MKLLPTIQIILRPLSSIINTLMIALVHCYQKCISPLKRPSCRYYPTCSSYTLQALKKHGPWRGSFLGIKRILRCHPWHEGGIDHVP